jgi:two-component system, NtrC family, response regulator GlrR
VLPPLRARPEDIPSLVAQILDALGADPEEREALLRPRFLSQLKQASWPGNVRELRNHVERCLVFDPETAIHEIPPAAPGAVGLGARGELPYAEARKQALADFDRVYLEELAARHDGDVSAMAAAAGIHRVHLYKLLRKARGRK